MIGGKIYSTKRSTINENVDSKSLLSLIIKNQTKIRLDYNGQYFIDRDGKYFCYILNYFREKKLILPENFNELKHQRQCMVFGFTVSKLGLRSASSRLEQILV